MDGFLGGKRVNRVGFGAMQLTGGGRAWGPPKDREQARAVLRRAVELGVDHLDTAQFYGPDVVNELIREALHPYPEGLRLASKVGTGRDAGGGVTAAVTRAELRAAVEANLATLGVERLDLVNFRPTGVDVEDSEMLAEALGALTELRDEGKLDLIGVSSLPTHVVERALTLADVAGVQNSFSILDQADRPTLDLCRRHGLAYVPYFPLGSALVGGPASLAADPAIAAVAAKHGATPSQVALAWLLALDDGLLLIPGTGSLAHLEQNMAAGELALDAEDMAALAAVEQLGEPMARLGGD